MFDSEHTPSLTGWDRPHRQYEPLDGQLELFGDPDPRQPHAAADGQQLLFDANHLCGSAKST